jgi:hypothetical protein
VEQGTESMQDHLEARQKKIISKHKKENWTHRQTKVDRKQN